MKNKRLAIVNLFLIFGLLLFVTVGVASVLNPENLRNNVLELFLLLQIVFGAVLITSAAFLTGYSYHMFVGLLLCGWGLITFGLVKNASKTIYECWPLYGIASGIFLFVTGYFKSRKMKVGYVFPSITIICFGIWYSLFSFKIIKMSFSKIVLISGPIFLLSTVVFLVLFFLAQQKNKKLVIKEDESEAFSEEELLVGLKEDSEI